MAVTCTAVQPFESHRRMIGSCARDPVLTLMLASTSADSRGSSRYADPTGPSWHLTGRTRFFGCSCTESPRPELESALAIGKAQAPRAHMAPRQANLSRSSNLLSANMRCRAYWFGCCMYPSRTPHHALAAVLPILHVGEFPFPLCGRGPHIVYNRRYIAARAVFLAETTVA